MIIVTKIADKYYTVTNGYKDIDVFYAHNTWTSMGVLWNHHKNHKTLRQGLRTAKLSLLIDSLKVSFKIIFSIFN